MARQMSATARPASSASVTTTLTVENSSQPPQETLVLQLRPRKKRVTWKEGTVDNEFMNKKSSKICCIFHKDKPFDEDDSDDDGHSHNFCPNHRSDDPDHDDDCRASTSGAR